MLKWETAKKYLGKQYKVQILDAYEPEYIKIMQSLDKVLKPYQIGIVIVILIHLILLVLSFGSPNGIMTMAGPSALIYGIVACVGFYVSGKSKTAEKEFIAYVKKQRGF